MSGDDAIVLAPHEGTALQVGNAPFVLKAGAADTGGGFSIIERPLAPGQRPSPQHTHPNAEAFYVLEGWVTFYLGARVEPVGGGGFVKVPGGAPHAFANEGTQRARMLVFHAPAMDEFLARYAALWEGDERPTPEQERALQAEYGIELAAGIDS